MPYLAQESRYIAFVGLEKVLIVLKVFGLDCVLNKGYESAKSKVRINSEFSDEFPVNVGVHQGSSPLLYIIVLEALAREFRTGCPWETLHVEDLSIIYKSLDMIQEKLRLWNRRYAEKGLKLNILKPKEPSRHLLGQS